MFPVAPIMNGITFVFTFHICCISTVRSSHIKIFSSSFVITFRPPKIEMSNRHNTLSLSRITISSLLLGLVLSVFHLLIPYFHYLFLLIAVRAHKSVPFLIFP